MKKLVLPLLLTASFLSFLPSAFSENKKTFDKPLGIAPYTFRKHFPEGVAETLDIIQEMGFVSIEGGGNNMDPHAYKKLCEERGLSIPAMGASYETLVNDTQSIIDRAKIYGANYVMTAWVPHEKGQFSLTDAKRTVKAFNTFGKTLADNGITFAYHAHGYELQPYQDGTLLDYIIKNTDPRYVSFEMDTFWIQFGGGDPAALLRAYPDRWKLMHLKDMRKGIAKDMTGLTDPDHDVEIGTGQLDFPDILKAADEIGIEHYFIEDESNRILTQIPASIRYLRSQEL